MAVRPNLQSRGQEAAQVPRPDECDASRGSSIRKIACGKGPEDGLDGNESRRGDGKSHQTGNRAGTGKEQARCSRDREDEAGEETMVAMGIGRMGQKIDCGDRADPGNSGDQADQKSYGLVQEC